MKPHSACRRPHLHLGHAFSALILLGLAAVLALACSQQGSSDTAPFQPLAQSLNGEIALGVWQPGLSRDMRAVQDFERSIDAHVSFVNLFQDWNATKDGPNTGLLKAIAAHGSVPMITWSPQTANARASLPPITLADIAAGRYDGYIRTWARALRAYKRPVLLRWAHEMNGDWYPWGYRVNGNTAAQYVAAWRHIHDIFTAEHAANVEWVWCPNVTDGPADPLEAYFPGDAYVDWVGLDGYNRVSQGWKSFAAIFADAYNRITRLTSAPLMIAEFGSGEAPGDTTGQRKAAWIHDALASEIPTDFPLVRAVIWFNESKVGVERDGEDWRLATPMEVSAFSQAVAKAPYNGSERSH